MAATDDPALREEAGRQLRTEKVRRDVGFGVGIGLLVGCGLMLFEQRGDFPFVAITAIAQVLIPTVFGIVIGLIVGINGEIPEWALYVRIQSMGEVGNRGSANND